MRHYTLESTGYAPVSHNPEIMKKVLVPGGFSCVRHLSHVVLRPGQTAAAHSHTGATEVFYCVRGRAEFVVSGRPVALEGGACLVVEPGEVHGIAVVREETEIVYLMAAG